MSDANKIKELRKKTGMTQHKFAEYLGIPLHDIKNWEQGYRKPLGYVVSLVERVLRMEGML